MKDSLKKIVTMIGCWPTMSRIHLKEQSDFDRNIIQLKAVTGISIGEAGLKWVEKICEHSKSQAAPNLYPSDALRLLIEIALRGDPMPWENKVTF